MMNGMVGVVLDEPFKTMVNLYKKCGFAMVIVKALRGLSARYRIVHTVN